MVKVNLKKVAVKGIDGTVKEIDFSKEIGNAIYNTTKDIGELDLAREIYHTGNVELTKEQAIIVQAIVDQNFLAWAKEPLLAELNKIINSKK